MNALEAVAMGYAMVSLTGAPIAGMVKESVSAAISWLVLWPVILVRIAWRGTEEF